MELLKAYNNKSFWIITSFTVPVLVLICGGFYLSLDWFLQHFSNGVGEELVLRDFSWLINQVELLSQYFYKAILPITTSFVLLIAWLLWLFLRMAASSIFKSFIQTNENQKSPGKSKKDFIDQKIGQDRKRRLFLHSLSVLQREGRLLDFFDEDLKLYDDEQIGAAVRSIHEDCKQAVKKYIDPKPVIENEEGEVVTVEAGFDIDSVKLVGNVSGEPPFEGVLKHRGWKAGKKEIPKLSDIQDAGIITPAEVEVQ
ncbi:MAG: DUF2760 domain-containing protein [Desulfobacula sp.]|nr:DUF2760 domain-containing protein [Desulfobacula sp.]